MVNDSIHLPEYCYALLLALRFLHFFPLIVLEFDLIHELSLQIPVTKR